MAEHPALAPGGVAVITGAASGIGLAASRRFARIGLKVALADVAGPALDRAEQAVAAEAPGGAGAVIAFPTDVSRREEVEALREQVLARLGPVSVLMNNAGIEAGGRFASPPELWRRVIEVNFWGAVNGVGAFMMDMAGSGRPGAIINTGSKQGITTPPGNAPYNVSKAALKVMTEALAHELRNLPGCAVTAHLLIPGFVYTGLTRARGVTEKPPGAWTPEQTVDFLREALGRGDFYILCPDNEVDRATDRKRIAWAAGDITENRSALSRWDARYKDAFDAYMKA